MIGKPLSILLVDDDSSWQKINKIVLEKYGFQIDAASTKKDALQKIENHNYQIAVIDLRLVDEDQLNFDGIDIIRMLRKKRAEIRILVKSGYLSPDVEKELKALGVDGVTDKSATNKEFINCIMKFSEIPTSEG